MVVSKSTWGIQMGSNKFYPDTKNLEEFKWREKVLSDLGGPAKTKRKWCVSCDPHNNPTW